jgi:hypothetical protein
MWNFITRPFHRDYLFATVFALLLTNANVFASPPVAAAPPTGIDSIKVHKLYMDGEFEPAIAILESALKAQKNLSHNDSVFIFKHLGVMYAATYETRERGKLYMHQLLMVEPTAKIMDMYASDMIYMIFKNMQDEFQTNRARFDAGKGDPVQGDPNPKQPESHARMLIWIGAAVVAVGVGTWVLIASMSSGGGGSHNF